MTYTPPDHTPYQWHNAPARDTPLDEAHLEAAEDDIVQFARSLASSVAAYADADGTIAYVGPPSGDVTGATDSANIAAALAQVAPSTVTGLSGTVRLGAGTYVTQPIALPERVTLVGVGLATKVMLAPNAAILGNLITNQQNYSGVNDAQACAVRNMCLDGNKSNQPFGSWNCGLVLDNSTPSGSYEYTDGRHQVSDLLIQNFTGDGFVQAGRGAVQAVNLQVWAVNGFGFNIAIDSEYVNCDAGGCGLDGWLIQGNNMLANCKAWFSGSALISTRYAGSPATPLTVTPPANAWDGGNIAGLTFSLASGFGNGFLFASIGGSSLTGNFNGGTTTGVNAQDNARAGFFVRGGRQTLISAEADSNNNNGTSDGTSTGTPTGSYAGFELDTGDSNVTISGLSWDRSANLNHQAAALHFPGGPSSCRIQLAFRGAANDGSNMAPLTATSVTSGNNLIELKSMGGGYSTPTYAASFTPDPFLSEVQAMFLTGNVTVNNPALTGTNTTGTFLVSGMKLTLMFSQDGTGGHTITLGSDFRTNGYGYTTGINATSTISFVYDGALWQAVSASNLGTLKMVISSGQTFLQFSQDGDSQARFQVTSSGTMQFGPGNAPRDTNVQRIASGVAGGSAWAATGLTGATAASRYIGATSSGAPVSGAFLLGDYIIDHTGKVWICTLAGSPGTWTEVGSDNVVPNYAAITSVRTPVVESTAYVVGGAGSTGTNGSWTLGVVYFVPLDVAAAQTFTGLSTCISILGIGGTAPLVMMGLYPDNGTGTKPVVTGGPVIGAFNTQLTFDPTAGATTTRDLTWGTPQPLPAARYWAAWTVTSGTAFGTQPTAVTLNPAQNVGLGVLTNVSHRGWQNTGLATATSLPSSGAIFRGGGSWPIIGMKAQ